jgi:hypothetical protein
VNEVDRAFDHTGAESLIYGVVADGLKGEHGDVFLLWHSRRNGLGRMPAQIRPNKAITRSTTPLRTIT